MSQTDLAKSVNVTQGAVSHWELGLKVPGFDAVQAICLALKVKCTAFDGCDFGEGEEKPGRGRPRKK